MNHKLEKGYSGWRRFVAVGLVVLAGGRSWPCAGQEEAPPQAAAEPVVGAPGANTPPVAPAAALKRAQMHDTLRDPFWPVDFVRPVQPGEKPVDPEAASKAGEIEWLSMEKLLRATVKGVSRLPSRGGAEEFLAMVNGKFAGVGDTVSLAGNGKTYRWKVASITLRDGPVFERLTAMRGAAPVKK